LSAIDLFWKYNLPNGRRVSASREVYQKLNPKSKLVTNSYVNTVSSGMVWKGDLDLVLDLPVLNKIVQELGEHIFVLSRNEWPKRDTLVWASDGSGILR